MPTSLDNKNIARIQAHALGRLAAAQRETVNLHLDLKVYAAGEPIGPRFQKLAAPRPSILVFADDDPMANFGHDCRYWLYDPETGLPHTELHARFPPSADPKPTNLKPFHLPIQPRPTDVLLPVIPILRCPILLPDGERYAILYSGMSNKRHLNDLEFAYRMLIDRYHLKAANIYVCQYDATLDTQDGVGVKWPGDNTAYRIKPTHQGNRAGFQAALAKVKAKIKDKDLLFIHTNNHGDNFGQGSFLCAYPNWDTYTATDFCADLHALPHYQDLIVMMEQCNAGGFNAPILAASTATNTSVASAAIATKSSYASPDGNWDSFARDWIAAQIGHAPNGGALGLNPDSSGDGAIEAFEAFDYAVAVKNPSDSPNFSQNAAGGQITLSQKYAFHWTWCWILKPLLDLYYEAGPVPYPGPGPLFQERLAGITPEVQKILLPEIEKAALELRRQMLPKIEPIVNKAFEAKP